MTNKTDLTKARQDLDYFSQEFFSMPLYDWQKEIAQDDHWQKVIIKGRGAGGSFLGRKAMIQFALKNKNAIILLIANAKHQILRTQRQRLHYEIENSRLKDSVDLNLADSISFNNGSQIIILPNEPNSIRGFQPLTALKDGKPERSAFGVVIEEGAFVENVGEVIKALEYPLFNVPKDKRMFWIITSPSGKNSPIYPIYKRGLEKNPDVKSWNVPSYANPQFELNKAGKSEAELKMEIEAQFCESVGNFFAGVIDQNICDYEKISDIITIGVDMALSGSKHGDSTAIAVVGKSKIDNVDLYKLIDLKIRKDWSMKELEDLIAQLSSKYRTKKVIVEVYQGQKLMEDLRARKVACDLIHPTNDFQNLNFHKWRALLENKQFLIPKDKALIEELSDFTYALTTSGRTTFSHTPNGHDDRVYAILYALSALFEATPLNLDHCDAGATREFYKNASPYAVNDDDDDDGVMII